jgi:hypothetical protein
VDEFGKDQDGRSRDLIEVLSQNFPERTEENYAKWTVP